ncbi:MAG TPA: penicillin acylase family protein, partial [Anaerolineales bacterium]|nr:penicillin acylase family protein [Anaerolineales bacterium]
MSKTWLALGIGLGLIFVLALALFGGWTWFSRQALPDTSGAVEVAGLQQPVEIVRDEYGVAHIYAHSPEDLFFAQGYTHAQERFWQMEFQRRTAKGRLAEIFWTSVLGTDRSLRQFGFKQLTEQSYTMLDSETKRVVDAYSAGINAYIQDRTPAQLGLEFALLGLQGVDLEVEPWAPEDSLIWAEMMVFDQSDRMRTELGNLDLLIAVGEQGFADLNPPYRADRPVIIDSAELPTSSTTSGLQSPEYSAAEQTYLRSAAAQSLGANAAPQAFAVLGFGVTGGSNSFVVAGERTTTGMPLLANDPHMAVNMPALWYEVGMHCLEKSPQCIYNFRGFSLPGVPGILIGHNDQIAWGLTNAAFDAEDVFLERINPENPNQYEVNGEWVDMEIRREEIFVQGQAEPEVLLVRSTRNGVVASDVMVDYAQISYPESGPQLYALAYAWTALEPIRSAQAVLMVNRAQNWDEFYEALRYFDAGKQNWIFADIQGNIGYVMPGKVPVRAAGDGSLPVPGWTDEFIWTGFIPYEDLPHVFNPQQGYVATANNPQVRAEDYPYLLNVSHDRGQRAQRIVSLIENDRDGLTVDDMQA